MLRLPIPAAALAAAFTLLGCADRQPPPPEPIDPARLEAVREDLSRIREEVRAVSMRTSEVSRGIRATQGDAGPEPRPPDPEADPQPDPAH